MSQHQLTASSPKPIATDLAQAALTWKVVPIASALVEVGVPQLIPLDGSSVDVAQLAQQAKVDADLLYRYMRYVSSLGIFKEQSNRHFAHNDSSKQLFPGHLTFYYLLVYGSTKSGLLNASTAYVTQLRDPSKAAIDHALKISVWEHMTPETEKHFADYMNLISCEVMPGILEHIILPEIGIVADVGCGYGHVLLEFLKANPKLTGIIYELPTVTELAKKGLMSRDPQSDSIYAKYPIDVKQRVSVVAGDYTDVTQLKQIANADVLFFKWIFHNNNDATCSKILAALYQIMKPTAKIVICDCVLKHTPNEYKLTIVLDLIMTEAVNGKQRTKEEWTQLLSDGDGYQYNVSFGEYSISRWELDLITLTKKVISS